MHFNDRADAIGAHLQALPELPTLEGAHVRLRAVRDEDIDGLFALFSDPRVMRWWSRPPMAGREEAVSYAAEMRNGFRRRDVLPWVMADLATDACIGTTTLYSLNAKHLKAEIGYALQPAHWGRGRARDAVSTALSYAFGPLGFNRIGADIAPGNDASTGLLTRLGFRAEGHLRQSFCTQRELQDSLIYGLLAEEWAPTASMSTNATKPATST